VKIRVKVSLLTGLTVIGATAALTLLFLSLQKHLIEKNLTELRTAQRDGFAAVCRQAATLNNELLLVNYVRLLKGAPGMAYAYFADKDGQIVVHTDAAFYYKTEADWAAQRPTDALELAADVETARGSAGRAVVGFSKSHQAALLQKAFQDTLARAVATAGLVALAGLGISFLFGYLLTRPVQALAEGSEKIGRGEFRTEVPVTSGDEIGELARRFNVMAKQLAVLDDMKDEFIACVSHELRSPLAAIKTHVETLLYQSQGANGLSPSQKQYLNTIIDNAVRLGVYVSNVLDAAKIKAGRMDYALRPVDAGDVAQKVVALYSGIARKKEVTLTVEVADGLPAAKTDDDQLEHVLSNLVSNAIKFTEEGGRVALRARRENGAVEVSVSDTGRGIPEEELPKLFGRFNEFRMDGNAPTLKGTGLGLYIVKKTVEDMGGRISVQSREGQGTTFVLRLPAA